LSASQHCWITAADIRVTPGVATGLNSNPPPPELRPIATELAFCQRYFQSTFGNGVAPGTATHTNMVMLAGVAASGEAIAVPLFAQMMGIPAVSIWDGAGHSGDVSAYGAGTWTDSFASPLTPIAIGTSNLLYSTTTLYSAATRFMHFTASAEL
jgi:hypothetical protein